ncbi:MAG: alpha/beta hydrolase [Eubacterium sp.]|nr:alpha/beta hydrolase [Eubacterium sp.]
MAAVKEKKKTGKGRKVLLIILGVIVLIAVVAVIFINIVTKPVLDTDENRYAVGGMVYSDTVEYQTESGKGIRHNPMVRMMQMVWRFCADGDAAKHAVQTPPEDVIEDNDIAYIDDGNIYHRLDVYYPESAVYGSQSTDSQLPVIIDIHGGGWIYGDKDLNKYYCLELAHRGYVVFNISYRLVPDVTVNEQLQDCAQALQWISENMNNYPCDGKNIMLTGDSAGGQMAVYSAALLESPSLRETFDVVDGQLDLTALLLTSPVAFMKDGGAFSLYTRPMWGSDYRQKATYSYMDLDALVEEVQLPPTYLITSDGDALAHDQTLRAAELLESKGVQTELVNYGDGEDGKPLAHVFSVLDPFGADGAEAIDGALAFYQRVMAQQ